MKLRQIKEKIVNYKGTTLTKTVPMMLLGKLYND